jgi:serine O-acetyltransferase
MDLTTRLVYWRERPLLGRLARLVLGLVFHIDFPLTVRVGARFTFLHRGVGTIIHPATEIGDDVTVLHQVTIGMSDVRTPVPVGDWPVIRVGDGVLIGAGAKVLAPHSGLVIGAGTTIGANAVLLESTGPGEVWAGVPARRVR